MAISNANLRQGGKRAVKTILQGQTTPLLYYYTEFFRKSKLYVFVKKGENFVVE